MNFNVPNGLTLAQIRLLYVAEVTDYITNVCKSNLLTGIIDQYVTREWPLIEQYLVNDRGLDARASDLTCAFATHFVRR